MSTPGRVCPIRYRYGPSAIAAAPERLAETLYVIGGLYGNLQALATIESMARIEPGPVTLCFNGDFNWFNVDDAGFREINERVLRHDAILGNVESESVKIRMQPAVAAPIRNQLIRWWSNARIRFTPG